MLTIRTSGGGVFSDSDRTASEFVDTFLMARIATEIEEREMGQTLELFTVVHYSNNDDSNSNVSYTRKCRDKEVDIDALLAWVRGRPGRATA